jgi:hypothetical protein
MRVVFAFLVATAALAETPVAFPEHIDGRIKTVGKSGFVVDQNYNVTDPHSSYRRQNRRIVIDSHTRFEASARQDLRAGRDVDIIGTKDGSAVRATRVIVYEGKRPVRMPAGARVILPNGSAGTLR